MTYRTDADTALRLSVVRAVRAPSVHNTQPWRFVLRPGRLEVHADWGRQLRVLDPRGRQLLMSCGCAVFNARVALAATGYGTTVDISLSDDPIAVVRIEPGHAPDESIAPLDTAIDTRQTNRRRFDDDVVPDSLIQTLEAAAEAEGARLFPVVRDDDRLVLARLSQLADQFENADPAYRAELRRWTTDDTDRTDGVPSTAVPHVEGYDGDDVPIRDFDTAGAGALPGGKHSPARQCMALLGTDADGPAAWLCSGQALQRILLEITRAGYTSSPLTQVVEVPRTHAALRTELRLGLHPHLLLRIGKAAPTPMTRRRRLVEVLTELPD